jgi:hypothetical protein
MGQADWTRGSGVAHGWEGRYHFQHNVDATPFGQGHHLFNALAAQHVCIVPVVSGTSGLEKILGSWTPSPPPLTLLLSGSTKTMSVAPMVWESSSRSGRFRGGKGGRRGGLGPLK